MSASAKRRNPFDGLSTAERQDVRRQLAELIDRQSRILNEPTPDMVKPYLSTAEGS